MFSGVGFLKHALSIQSDQRVSVCNDSKHEISGKRERTRGQTTPAKSF